DQRVLEDGGDKAQNHPEPDGEEQGGCSDLEAHGRLPQEQGRDGNAPVDERLTQVATEDARHKQPVLIKERDVQVVMVQQGRLRGRIDAAIAEEGVSWKLMHTDE